MQMKLVYLFKKKGRMRFVSHLDMQRFLMRALNRTCLPIAFSQGFNPHPVMSLASALAMGYESDYEVFEIKINGNNIPKETALKTMRDALPEEMEIIDVRYVNDNHPSMMSLVTLAVYEITPPTEHMEQLKAAAREFLLSESVPGIRKTKSGEREVDLRPLCLQLNCSETDFRAYLMLTEQDTLKPALLMSTLYSMAKLEPGDCRYKRICLMGKDSVGNFRTIMEL